MTQDCPKCKGAGDIECECCHQCRSCPDCDGEGFVDVCILTFDIPTDWKNHDKLAEIKADAQRCNEQYHKLVAMNPRAKESYDRQLAQTLKNLNDTATDLEP